VVRKALCSRLREAHYFGRSDNTNAVARNGLSRSRQKDRSEQDS
jgi:hypothetical protein